MLATSVTGSDLLVLGTLLAAGAAVFASLNSWLKDRGDREDKRTQKHEDEREEDQDELARQGRVLDHLTVTMVGRPADPVTGLPKLDGFVDEQRDHNTVVDKAIADLRTEITTDNGGSTIKGSLKLARGEIAALRDEFVQLKASVDNAGGPS